MATITEPFVLQPGEEPRPRIQRAIDMIADKAQTNNYTIDWTTMQVLSTQVDSGVPAIGTITIMGVKVDGTPAP